MYLEYDSNNSGGNWWLKDKHWYALEKAGWEIEWRKDIKDNRGRIIYTTGRWLGTLASSAILRNISSESEAREAIDKFDALTGSNHRDRGCRCCGPPHSFTLYHDDGKYYKPLAEYDYYEDEL